MIKSTSFQYRRLPGGGIGCLILFILILAAAFYLIKGLYHLLWWAAPALIVLSVIINWRVIPDTISKWLDELEARPLSALLTAALVVIAFPFFSLWLFLKALGFKHLQRIRKAQQAQERQEQEFTDFEEITSTPMGEQPEKEPFDPPDTPEKEKNKKGENPYDSFFG